MSESALIYTLGTLLGSFLLACGAGIGYVRGRRGMRGRGDNECQTRYVLGKIEELSDWTTEYSGNVTQYQDEIRQISQTVSETIAGTSEGQGRRIVSLLESVMQSNKNLQDRLETAEQQLDRQRRQIEEYISEARTDALTGLANRRAFDAELDRVFNVWRSGGSSFVLAMVDVDHFKQVNDTHGHPVGDVVLRQVARILSTELRDAWCVARYGGEEFAILLPGTIHLAAQQIDNFRKLIRCQPIPAAGTELRVTISAGLTEPREDQLIGPIVRRADEGLYAAKKRGRDRVYTVDRGQITLVGAAEIASTR